MTSDRRFNQPVHKLGRKSIRGSQAEYLRLNYCALILLSKSMEITRHVHCLLIFMTKFDIFAN